MKLALIALLFVPMFAFAEESVAQTAEAETAVVVSRVLIEGRSVVTYYNEITEQVCTYAAASQHGLAPSLNCVNLHSLNDAAQEKVKARAVMRFN